MKNQDIKELLLRALLGADDEPSASPGLASDPWIISRRYLIRTVTHYWTGQLFRIYPNELVLQDAAWIPDTGRYSEATCIENLDEVEPREGHVIIGRGAIVDAVTWDGPLPRKVK